MIWHENKPISGLSSADVLIQPLLQSTTANMLKLKWRCNYLNGVQAFNFVYGFQRYLLYSTEANPSSSSFTHLLLESLGFSSQQSLSTSVKLSKFRKSGGTKNVSEDCSKLVTKSNFVINFFKHVGLDEPQIRKVVKFDPRILLSDVDKTLKPKIELLQGLGLYGTDLSKVITLYPSLLRRRLDLIIRDFRQVVGSDENVRRLLMNHNSRLMSMMTTKHMILNVKLLKKYGIPIDIIQEHIVKDYAAFKGKPTLFQDRLIRVEQDLGIPRDSTMFLYGIRVLSHFSKKTIGSKFQVFKSFGWEHSDILALMRVNPSCIGTSVANIKKKLGFFITELGYRPADFLTKSSLLTYSLDKRIVPRYKVLLILKEKGFIKMGYSLYTAVTVNECRFVKMFVLPYEEAREVYAKHVDFSEKLLSQGRENEHSEL